MRKGFCRLSGIVKEHFQVDLFDGHLFVSFNHRRHYVKILA
ncbi:IS66 family insertion sequence element accessory protein TnpB [Roseimaritima ulvae]